MSSSREPASADIALAPSTGVSVRLSDVMAVLSTAVAACMLARALQGFGAASMQAVVTIAALIVGALLVGSSTLWLGRESMGVAAVSLAGAAIVMFMRHRERLVTMKQPVTLNP